MLPAKSIRQRAAAIATAAAGAASIGRAYAAPVTKSWRACSELPEELRVVGSRDADVRAAERRDRAAARRALDEAELQEVRLVDVLDRLLLLTERRGERAEADRPAVELHGDRVQEVARLAVEALRVDLEQLQRLARNRRRDRALVPHLSDVAHTPEDPVRDARRAARARRDLRRSLGSDVDGEDAGTAVHDRGELPGLVVVEPEG